MTEMHSVKEKSTFLHLFIIAALNLPLITTVHFSQLKKLKVMLFSTSFSSKVMVSPTKFESSQVFILRTLTGSFLTTGFFPAGAAFATAATGFGASTGGAATLISPPRAFLK
jgi:hypothetical protein